MTGPRPDPMRPKAAYQADADAQPPMTAGEPSGVEEPVGFIDRFAWLALLPWGCSVSIVLGLALGSTLAGWRSR